jgi:Cu2+-exporting ATPase
MAIDDPALPQARGTGAAPGDEPRGELRQPDAGCGHCGLPVGPLGRRRDVLGQGTWFCCYGCCLACQVHRGVRDEPEAAAWLIRLGVGGFLAMNIMTLSLLVYAGAVGGEDAWLLGPVHVLMWLLATPLLATLGAPFFAGAWQGLREGRLVTDTLVSIGVLAAYAYSAVQVLRGSHLVYFDTASMVLLLFTLGRYLEAQGRARAARSLAPMLAAERAQVRVFSDSVLALRPVVDVQPGDLACVLPGERIPVDGLVEEGSSECDESILTGQPQRRAKAPGAVVHAGSVNGHGQLLVRATVAGAQSRWMGISRMVREALTGKGAGGDSVDRVAAAFIPGVLLLAAATAGYWASRGNLEAALLAGLAVLVVACPCSLGLAASLAGALAIGQAAQRGILIRGGAVLERLAGIRGVAFDKTGTLTQDELRFVGLRTAPCEAGDPARVLYRAAALALGSQHPVARAVLAQARRQGLDPAPPQALQAHPGAGLSGCVDDVPCAMGSAAFMQSLGWPVAVQRIDAEWGAGGNAAQARADEGSTVAWVGWQGRVRGRIALAAEPVPEAAGVVAFVQRRGLATLLLSGDGAAAVGRVAAQLGLAQWHADLMPEAKVQLLRAWAGRHGPVAMVGDGLNDGPVLAAAAVGIAVGGAADLAKESADVVLPRSGLASLPWLLEHARGLRRSVRANMAWAFGYNALALTLAAAGWLQPVLAAALMAGSSLVVAGRSWRASRRGGAGAADAVPPAVAVAPAGGLN